MEATREQEDILNKILPPRIEDAGLEDCALPPDSIKEAFFKAACAVKSRASSLFHDEDGEEESDIKPALAPGKPGRCVEDPSSAAEDISDVVVGISPFPDAPGPCRVVKGGGVVEEGKDEVVVGGGGVAEDGGESGCVEGLKGLNIEEEKNKTNKNKEEDEEDRESEGPTLVEGVV